MRNNAVNVCDSLLACGFIFLHIVIYLAFWPKQLTSEVQHKQWAYQGGQVPQNVPVP